MFNPETPPDLDIAHWFGTDRPITLAGLKGKVVVAVAFQMLCPGCVEHGLPQARRIRERFSRNEVAVIGLHTVFEHHAVMTPAALEVFVSEYRLPFPVGVDAPNGTGIPKTMAAYSMQGTPTLLIFDRAGRLRRHYFGRPDDMLIAAEVMALAIEAADAPREQAAAIERRLAATLVSPANGEGNDHGHGGGHGHGHDHAHAHAHGDGCGCGHDHHHDHTHGHDHPAHPPASTKPGKPAKGKR